MSRLLRDLSERHVKKASQLMQKGKPEETLKELEIAEKDAIKAKANDIFLNIQTIKGKVMQVLGAYEEALKIHISSLKAIEEFLSKDPSNEFYQSIFQTNLEAIDILSDLFHSTGHFIQAKSCYDLTLSIYIKFLDNEPENVDYQLSVAVTFNNLGNLLSDMGKMEEAKNAYENALKIHDRLHQKYSRNVIYQSNVGTTLNNLGFLLLETGHFDEAEKSFEKSFNILKKIVVTDSKNIIYQSKFAMTINNMGNLFAHMGRLEEAEKKYEEALDLRQKILERDLKNVSYQSDVAMTLNNLGGILTNLGLLEEAKERLESSLDMRRKIVEIYPENVKYQSYVGATLNNLGALLSYMGRLEEAKNRHEEALDLKQKILEKDLKNVSYQSDVANSLNSLGNVLTNIGRLEEAKERYENSLDIRRKIVEIYPENVNYRSDLAMTLNNLGSLYSEIWKIGKARDRFEEALDIYKELLEIDTENVTYQLRVGIIINNLGNLFYRVRSIEEAKDRYTEALEISEILLNKDPENIRYQSFVGTILNNLGALQYLEKKYLVTLELCSRAIKYALNSANLDLLFKIYWSMGKCYEKLNDNDRAFTNYKESIEYVESIRDQFSIEEIKMDIMWDKAVIYNDMISFLCIRMGDSETAWEYLGRFKSRSLLDSLRLLKLEAPENVPEELITQEEKLLSSIRTFNGLIRKATKTGELNQLTQRIKENEAKLDKVYNRIQELSPEYVDLRKGQPLGIKEIKELIGSQTKKTAFVEYYTTHENIFIFVMRSDEKNAKVEIADLSSNELFDYLNRYYMEIVDIPDTVETWQELSKKLIEPIFNYIDGCELVYLIPHGLLHYLPLHALFVKNKRFNQKKRLIEYFPIVYVPNLTTLKYAQRRNSQCLKPCLSLGYTPHDCQKELFEGEAKLVAEQFNVEPILGDHAKSEVLNNISSDVIHASCHGGFNTKEPLNSGLCLKDGILTVREIFEMSIKTNLLVLSACQTGLNSQKPGDDLVGLTRAFLYAGARSLIVSLWSVEAKSTFEYMKNLYKELKEGKDKAEAVQKIQIDFINGKYGDIHSHPYFWAPFILIGDWK